MRLFWVTRLTVTIALRDDEKGAKKGAFVI
jgi:hypothetical protein